MKIEISVKTFKKEEELKGKWYPLNADKELTQKLKILFNNVLYQLNNKPK